MTRNALQSLADRLSTEDDRLLDQIKISSLSDIEQAGVQVSCILGLLAGELQLCLRTGDGERLRELADHVSEWAGERVAYGITGLRAFSG